MQRNVGSVMISYSSWNGAKLHGHQYLITTVLKGELGFSGFVVSDWNGIDQIDGAPGFTAAEVRTAINAGHRHGDGADRVAASSSPCCAPRCRPAGSRWRASTTRTAGS